MIRLRKQHKSLENQYEYGQWSYTGKLYTPSYHSDQQMDNCMMHDALIHYRKLDLEANMNHAVRNAYAEYEKVLYFYTLQDDQGQDYELIHLQSGVDPYYDPDYEKLEEEPTNSHDDDSYDDNSCTSKIITICFI
jgi:hypothetical protein